jgi:hypothetical protein
MLQRLTVDPCGKTITITNLTVSNQDFLAVVTAQPPTNREQTVLDIIAVGSAAMRRVQTTVEIDLIEKRFGGLASNFERSLTSFEKQATEALTKRFSPTESGSYTKHIADLVATARKDVQGWTSELAKSAKDLLDPDKKSSAVGRLEALLEAATTEFEHMFDPGVKGSYASQLNQQLETVFGANGRSGTITSSLEAALKPVLAELRELKERMEARKAVEQIIATSSLKGRPFEDLIGATLSTLARPYGDDVAAVGSGNGGCRAGDFLIAVNGSGKRIVVEARNRKQLSLPAIKGELDHEMTARAADFAIYVSSGVEMLPQHVGEFQIYDDKLVTTVENLPIAYRVARLMTLCGPPDGEADLGAVRSALSKIRDAIRSLRDMKSKASQVKNLAEKIHSDAGSTEEIVVDLLDEAEHAITSGKAA